ncbi:hypothetical protein CC1G_05614 [Coprinopsis cinerea okayama7|uniref:Uncharacterized protein n=1 Tax=Coprinopsis cinerea (strain Okayama-7 / 130 / ATCC MYA-4618 / FGSC 9003) TaxID=240176 RepID=A8P1M7_COPC7|nr:hypothetical protein CC1G_05614 [Coprinopsis cinerea okayama7\|eukprot:XP_001838133.2 hypothetical protein CC1G_05614 [Coprinopsis cinerea okayama7\
MAFALNPPSDNTNTMTSSNGLAFGSSPEDLRLKFMTLLAMYDLLPYSISHPPNAREPLDLKSAIDANSLQRCLISMTQQGILTEDEARSLSAVYNTEYTHNMNASSTRPNQSS